MNIKYTDMTENNLTMTLTLEDDSLLKCAALCKIEMEEGAFVILLPLLEDGEQDPDGDVYFFRYEEQDGEPVLHGIESDEVYMKVADAFDAWLDMMEQKEV